MKNFKNKALLIIIGIILLITTFNCFQSDFFQNNQDNTKITDKKYGGLKINIIDNDTRTILPDFIAINHYDMTGDGPNGSKLSVENITGTSKTINSLLVGSWKLTVLGKDASNNIIAKGEATADIIEDQTTDVNIIVNYCQSGTGIVDLTIDWPGTISVDSVILKINDATSEIYTTGDSVNYTNNSTPSGSHKFFFSIKNAGQTIAAVTESVHVYDYHTTSKTISLLSSDFKSAPVAPSGLSATEGHNKIVLNWTDNSNVETGFVVERSETSGAGFTALGGTDVTPLSANTTTFDDATAVIGTTYYYRVKAVNSFGSSDYSNEANCADFDRGNFKVNINLISPMESIINWGAFNNKLYKNLDETLDVTAILDGATSWNWYLNGVSLGVTINQCVINSTGYNPGIYNLTVIATKNGLSYSSSIKFEITDYKGIPVPPINLLAKEGLGGIILNWTDKSNVETGFVFERSETTRSGFVVIGGTDVTPLAANTITYNDTTAVVGTTYYYRIKAINQFGNSEYSIEASAKIELPEVISIYPYDDTINVALSSNIVIIFSEGLDTGTKGSISFGSPVITFEDTTNCSISFIKTNVTDDTVIVNPNNLFNELISYSNINIIGFKDKNNNFMQLNNDNSYNFTTEYFPIITITKNGYIAQTEVTTDVIVVDDSGFQTGYPKYQWTQSTEFPSGGIWTTFNSGDILLLTDVDGEYYLHIWAIDDNSNESKVTSNKYILDNTGPKIGRAIWFSNTTTNSLTVNCGEATDVSLPVQYKLYYSTTDNLWDATDCETNGMVAMDWSTDTIFNLLSLNEKKSYYFNVLVKDAVGNLSIYDMKQGDTDPSILNIGKDGYGVNGSIDSMIQKDGILYIGGSFSQIGRYTEGALLDISSDYEDTNFPVVKGNIHCVISDGSGGWIIGGAFTKVGEYERNGIAWINSDGSVREWNPNSNGIVRALTILGSNVYAGGEFTTIGGQIRNRIAAIDITTGIATSWDPNANNSVYALSISGSNVYAGGSFSTIGGQIRNRIAAIDITTGLTTSWNPNASGTVSALSISGGNVYAGGSFSTIGGQNRNYISAIDITTGLATTWNPNADSIVYALSISGSNVYVGGSFSTIGGQIRNRIAAIDITTGLATSWNPNASGTVSALSISGSNVYAGGSFSTIGGQIRNRIAAIDITTGLATSWNPNVSGTVYALSISGSNVYVGGSFSTIGGQTRNNIAAIDITTGLATSWNPNASGTVSALSISGSNVYAGGSFSKIGGQNRNYISAIDITTGLATTWNPNANSFVYALSISGSNVYVGGSFSTIGGQIRNRIAAIDITTGLATDWNPNPSHHVYALSISGSNVYVGGYFSTIGGQSRNRIAAIDITTGYATSWNPNANGSVSGLAISGSSVYTEGIFTTIGGQSRNRIAAIDIDTGLATSWNPNANNDVYALALSGSNVYFGGYFTTIGGQNRNRIAAIDIGTGLATSWNPNSIDNVYSLIISGSYIYTGGSFSTIGGERRKLAAIDLVTGEVK
ncbi:MAG: Ig-like domain-containing protein [Spirochaetes bacterium]|nr:Ig-like domain-containing protein [Spirochaetota bacterium]